MIRKWLPRNRIWGQRQRSITAFQEQSERFFQGEGTNFVVKREYEGKKHEELAKRGQPEVDFLHNETRLRLLLFVVSSLTHIAWL
jgi:hypothetical protein